MTSGPIGRGALSPHAEVTTRAARARALMGALIRYGLVGVANAATYYATYLAVHPHADYLVAHVVGLGTAMVVSFLLNCRFTFRVRPTWKRLLLYPTSQAVNIIAVTVGVVGLVHLGVDERIAPLVAAALAVPASFLAARIVITRTAGSSARTPTTPPAERRVAASPARSTASLLDAVTLPMPQIPSRRRISAGRR